jgi:hypothetical protein
MLHKVNQQQPPLNVNFEYNMSCSAAALPTNKSSICSNLNVSNDLVTFRSFTEGTNLISMNAKNKLMMQMIKMKLCKNENMALNVNPMAKEKFGGY